MFNPAQYENSRPDGFAVLEVRKPDGSDGGGEARPGPRRFVPLKRTHLEGEVTGPLAALRLTQVYGYARTACDRVLEAVYRFPLPGDAAVTGVRVRFGEVEITAELKEREHAESEYEDARREGRQAALLTRESPDVFTLLVAGLIPDQDVTVETRYVQLGRAEGTGWTLRVPLTTAPRYVRSDEQTGRHAQGQPLLLLRDPGHRFSLDVRFPGAATVTSPTHVLDTSGSGDTAAGGAGEEAGDTQPEGNVLRVRLREGEVLPDRDCVLAWQPAQADARPALNVWTYDDNTADAVRDRGTNQGSRMANDHTYFLAAMAPPSAAEAGGHGKQGQDGQRGAATPAREVILLVDHSGSMEGPKWEAADWAVKQFLAGLRSEDQFNLGVFHDRTTWFAQAPQPAAAATVKHAGQFLESHRESGGTQLGVALEQALDQERGGSNSRSTQVEDGALSRHVLIVTDAQVTDEGRILRMADAEYPRDDRRRISVLCVDAAPNSFLAQELAERGGGLARFVTSAPDEEDITTALDEVLADWGQPVVTSLRLQVSRGPVEAAIRRVSPSTNGTAPDSIDLGDLPAGRTVWIAGRARIAAGPTEEFESPQSGLHLRLFAGDRDLATWPRGAAALGGRSRNATGVPALKALFGAQRVLALEFLIHAGHTGEELAERLQRLGYDPQVLGEGGAIGGAPRVYAENARQDAERALRGLLAREALHYGLASSETAFVATRMERGRPVEGSVPVANALAAGWSDGFLGGGPVMLMAAPAMSGPPAFQRTNAKSRQHAGGGALRQAASYVRTLRAPGSGGQRAGSAPGADTPASTPPPPSGAVSFDAALSLAEGGPAARGPATATLFSGIPVFQDGEAMLFDLLGVSESALPKAGTLTRLSVMLGDGAGDPEQIDPNIALLLYVEDLAAPRARVRLRDVLRQGGARPLNLARAAGQPVRLVLLDPSGAWKDGVPRLEVSVHYRA